MASKQIILLGGTGQVGHELKHGLSMLGKVIAPTRAQLDLANIQAVNQFLEANQPNLIVNAAAWTAVDAAEEHPQAAHALNAALPKILSDYTAQRGIWLIHYSTDYVYPGTGDRPWVEGDTTAPLSTYGKTKLAGDQAIIDSGSAYLIFRTSWVYSTRGNNFMNTMLRLGLERDKLQIVGDQMGAPTPARFIAEVTLLALHGNHAKPRLQSGIYHLAPRGETSWYEFACHIFKQAGDLGLKLAIKPEGIKNIPTKDWSSPAERPLNSRLSLQHIEQALGIEMPHWQSQLTLTLADHKIIEN